MKSVWSESCTIAKRGSLKGDIEVDTVVIGAGIAGILTAYMLNESGVNVAIIECNEIGSGNIKNTTAKITSQHNLIYHKLINEFGKEKAMQYAKANELAIEKYREIIEKNNINCDFEEKDAYVYSLEDIDEIKEEVKVVNELGISAEFTKETDLPFKVKGAIRFKNQGQFNPIKFIKAISEDLVIYEKTKALEVKDNIVITERGNITAKNIVIATHYPFINFPGYYFMRMHQERSYIIALENADDINGMYIDISKKGYSFRNYKELLLIGGASHRTGKNEESGCYEELRKIAKELYPNSRERYYWSSQDCMTLDEVPYIGRYSSKDDNIYVATGFNKWGMTGSMVASIILCDMILGKKNEFAEIFSPQRFDISASSRNFVKDGIKVLTNFIGGKLKIPDENIEHIKNGEGDIVEYNGEKSGVYKDKFGKVFIVTTKCPHLGCELKWNKEECSWDCPCHGSRFDYKGNLLDAPATSSIRYE
ncbi:FAD-dependent oxidoreductase [Clostridium carnis]